MVMLMHLFFAQLHVQLLNTRQPSATASPQGGQRCDPSFYLTSSCCSWNYGMLHR